MKITLKPDGTSTIEGNHEELTEFYDRIFIAQKKQEGTKKRPKVEFYDARISRSAHVEDTEGDTYFVVSVSADGYADLAELGEGFEVVKTVPANSLRYRG